MFPNLHDLNYFLTLAEIGNISRAAERLGISQPALSMAVKRLEDLFDTSLVLRAQSGISLTKSGEKLIEKSQELIHQWQQISFQVTQQEKAIEGHYRIGAHPAVAHYTIHHFLPDLLKTYHKLNITLKHQDLSRKITEDVISGRLDMGIVINPIPHPDLVIVNLFDNQVLLWRSCALNPLNTLGDPQAVLLADFNLKQTRMILSQLKKSGVEFPRVTESNDLRTIERLILAGCGLGILPSAVVGSHQNMVAERYDIKVQDQVSLIYKLPMTLAGKTIAATIKSSLKIPTNETKSN